MVKINVLVLQRENIIRNYNDFEKEQKAMRRLFDKHTSGMIVRFDLTDITINNYRNNKILGKGIKDFYTKYNVTETNLAALEESGYNFIGLLNSSYINNGTVKKSKELEEILDKVEKTAALFGYTDDYDEVLNSTFDTIRKGFVEFNPNENIANKQRDYIVVKGIPELTIVLCTVRGRADKDLNTLKKQLKKYFILPSIKEMSEVSNIFVKLKEEIKVLRDVEDKLLNTHYIHFINPLIERDNNIDAFVNSINKQNASILQILHSLNAIGKAEIKGMNEKERKEVNKIESLEDLMKLTCII